jgi:hypothetical protein
LGYTIGSKTRNINWIELTVMVVQNYNMYKKWIMSAVVVIALIYLLVISYLYWKKKN